MFPARSNKPDSPDPGRDSPPKTNPGRREASSGHRPGSRWAWASGRPIGTVGAIDSTIPRGDLMGQGDRNRGWGPIVDGLEARRLLAGWAGTAIAGHAGGLLGSQFQLVGNAAI